MRRLNERSFELDKEFQPLVKDALQTAIKNSRKWSKSYDKVVTIQLDITNYDAQDQEGVLEIFFDNYNGYDIIVSNVGIEYYFDGDSEIEDVKLDWSSVDVGITKPNDFEYLNDENLDYDISNLVNQKDWEDDFFKSDYFDEKITDHFSKNVYTKGDWEADQYGY